MKSFQLEAHSEKILKKMNIELRYSNMHAIGISKREGEQVGQKIFG